MIIFSTEFCIKLSIEYISKTYARSCSTAPNTYKPQIFRTYRLSGAAVVIVMGHFRKFFQILHNAIDNLLTNQSPLLIVDCRT